MSLERFCQRSVVSLSPEQNIVEACRLLQDNNVGCLVVLEKGALCGILTDRDIALKVSGQGKVPEQTTVREVMTPNPAYIHVDRTLHQLTTLMHNRHVRRVPIVDAQEKLVGLVTLDDLLMLLSEEFSDLREGISVALLGKPQEAEETEFTPPFGWLMSYL
jgi:CBS domain-containing protein